MSETQRGLYVVVEGGDGLGKSTQVELLVAYLKGLGKQVMTIREPGGTPMGEALRLIIKDRGLPRSPQTNLDLFTAGRRELAENVLRPNLEAGTFVISDRNWFSTVAYQGFGEGLPLNLITGRSREAMGDYFMPGFSVILNDTGEVSRERMRTRNTSGDDHFEQMGTEFARKVNAGYLWVAEEYGIPVINASQTPEAVHSEIRQKLLAQHALALA